MQLEHHPLADCFRMMTEKEHAALVRSIEDNGQQCPIILLGGKILDGRNRYKACLQIGLAPEFKDYDGENPAAFVAAMNLDRRHMNESERGVAALKLQAAAAESGEKLTTCQVAEMMNVSDKTVKRASVVTQHAEPEVVEAMNSGAVRVSDAAAVARLEPEVQREAVRQVASGESSNLKAAAKKILKDKEGREVPERLRHVWSTLEDFAKAEKALGAVSEAFIQISPHIVLNQSIKEKVREIHDLFDRARPDRVCPKCDETNRKYCKHCGGIGYTRAAQAK